mmetsp:Transcript_30098/g.28762  ORF Transcript_30098/g.28762 Transcript_30098/m.28762 type:complete len:432 (-) Transcript_30098:28-1323(-)
MGKGAKRNTLKSSKRKGGDPDSDDSDGNSDNEKSVSSSIANTSVATSDQSDIVERLSEAVEKLAEKRPTTRETALKNLLKIIRGNNQTLVESIMNYNETICSSLNKMLRRPASLSEGRLCLEVFCLLCLLDGPDSELFEEFEQILSKLVNGSSAYEELRTFAIAALAFSSYICSNEANYRIMTLCEDVLNGESEGEPASSSLKARAAASWSLLASINSTAGVLIRCKERIFEAVVELFEDSEVDVKISAGTTFAFLFEIADSVIPDVDYTISGLQLCDNPSKILQSVTLLQQIAKESSKRISKKDKKEQRAAFRDVEDWIVNGERPYESIRMQGAVIECKDFATQRLLEDLKGILGDGFHSSLKVFPVVKDILGVLHITDNMDGNGKNSIVEKGGATDKLRSGYRKQERQYRDIDRDCFEGGFEGLEDDEY